MKPLAQAFLNKNIKIQNTPENRQKIKNVKSRCDKSGGAWSAQYKLVIPVELKKAA